MTTARKLIVNPAVTPFYHCISRCVRRAFLCGEGREHRKQWIEDRLRELAEVFATTVCGFSILDNHLHVLLRLDFARVAAWSPEEIAGRWLVLCPPRRVDGKPSKVTDTWIADRAKDSAWTGRAAWSDPGRSVYLRPFPRCWSD
jgi:hypothetical protein